MQNSLKESELAEFDFHPYIITNNPGNPDIQIY